MALYGLLNFNLSLSLENFGRIQFQLRVRATEFVCVGYTEGRAGDGRSRGPGESPRDVRHQVPERLAVGFTTDRHLRGDEAIPDRSGHRDAIDPNAEASGQGYPGGSPTPVNPLSVTSSSLSANCRSMSRSDLQN